MPKLSITHSSPKSVNSCCFLRIDFQGDDSDRSNLPRAFLNLCFPESHQGGRNDPSRKMRERESQEDYFSSGFGKLVCKTLLNCVKKMSKTGNL